MSQPETAPGQLQAKPDEIEWQLSFEEALKNAGTQNKPIMLVFHGVSGKRLDDRVFSVPDVIELSKKFVCLRVGLDQRELIDKYNVQEFPAFVFTDSQGGEYDRASGYKSWQSYMEILKNALIPVEVEYGMQMNPSSQDIVDIECIFKNIRGKSMILILREKHDKIANISYDSTDGRPGLEKIEENIWIMKFNTPDMKTVTVKYQIGLKILARTSYQPEYASYAGDDYGVLDGRALFLEPQDLNTLGKVKVRLDLKSGWQAITPWDIDGDEGLFWANSVEEVVDSVFCIGQFQSAKRGLGDHEIYTVYCGPQIGTPDLERRIDVVLQIFRHYMTSFGDFPYKRYMAVFTGPTPDGKYVTGSSAHVVGFSGPVNVDISFVAHEIFHVWNGGVINQKSDYEGWFKEGFTQYYGYLTPYRLGLYSKERFLNFLRGDYEEYLNVYGTSNDISLSRVKEGLARKEAYLQPESPRSWLMYRKGALVASMMNYEIKERTGGLKSLDDLMYYMFQQFREKRYSTEDILKALNSISGDDFTSFFSDLVYGKAKLPITAISYEPSVSSQK